MTKGLKIVLGILCIVSIVLIVLNRSLTNKLRDCQKEIAVIQQIEENKRTQQDFTYWANFRQQMFVDGEQWNDVPLLAPDGVNTTLKSELSLEKPCLIVRISETYCDECVSSILLKLQRLSKELPLKQNVIILATYSNKRAMKLTCTPMSDFRIYEVEHHALSFQMEENMQPYCLLIYGDMRVRHSFTPNKDAPSITEFYLRAICKRYFN